jgi:hypothetical protein
MSYPIEKGTPVPETLGFGQPKYPFGRMDIGDSFFVPLDGLHPVTIKVRLSSAGYYFRKHNGPGFRFSHRNAVEAAMHDIVVLHRPDGRAVLKNTFEPSEVES